MLSAYLRSKESIDVSLQKRMAGAKIDVSVGFRLASDSTRSDLELSSTTHRHPSAAEATASELELGKFMASLTAAESPDAVIRTIFGKQELKHCRR